VIEMRASPLCMQILMQILRAAGIRESPQMKRQKRIYKRQTKSGEWRWDATVDKIDAKTGRKYQEKHSCKSLAEAKLWIAEEKLAEAKGTAVRRSTDTVADLLQLWLETHGPSIRDTTLESYERVIRLHLLPDLGAIPVQKLSAKDLQTWINTKLKAGVGARTVQLALLRLKQSLTLATNLGMVQQNVCERVQPPKTQKREKIAWRPQRSAKGSSRWLRIPSGGLSSPFC
jgi:integrase